MNFKTERTFIYSELERSIVYDYWFNPNQTMQQLADKYGVSSYKIKTITSRFIRTKDVERQQILKGGPITLASKINHDDP